MSEGYHTWNLKDVVEIETDNYPELQGKTPEEMAQYLTAKCNSLPSSEGDDPSSWSLFDELNDQDTISSKEKNYEIAVHLADKMK